MPSFTIRSSKKFILRPPNIYYSIINIRQNRLKFQEENTMKECFNPGICNRQKTSPLCNHHIISAALRVTAFLSSAQHQYQPVVYSSCDISIVLLRPQIEPKWSHLIKQMPEACINTGFRHFCCYRVNTCIHSYFAYIASFFERRYTQYWFMLTPSLCECSANALCKLRGILSLNCPE